VYYFAGYFGATEGNDQQVDMAVPSGNFGNICAGHIARTMGLPIRNLVCATNENDVLDEFFRTGVYRPRTSAETHVTSSPSMDISKASNFERFIFDLVGRDGAKVRELWAQVDAGGAFDLNETPFAAKVAEFGFVSGSSSHTDRLATIKSTRDQYGVVVDTHTADGLKVAAQLRDTAVPMLVLETAQAAKFEETIREALGEAPPRPEGFDHLEGLPQRCEVMPVDVNRVKDFIRQHVND
jgi:threonine synthase